MRLKVGDLEVRARVEEESEVTSRHTGNTLQKLVVSFRAPDEESEDLVDAFLESKGEVISLDAQGAQAGVWKVTQRSSSTSSAHRGTDYEWELLRKEELDLESLSIAGNEFTPYHYQEYFMGESLGAAVRVNLSAQEFDSFKNLAKGDKYFPVVRRGINNEEREMRFGRALWSQHDERFKVLFYLVERTYDDPSEPKDIDDFRDSNIRLILAQTADIVDGLLTLLERKGMITGEEREGIESLSQERLRDSLFRFDEVDDLDEIPITSWD